MTSQTLSRFLGAPAVGGMTRRDVLTALSGGALAGALAAGAAVAASSAPAEDPSLAFVARLDREIKAVDALPDAESVSAWGERVKPLYALVLAGEMPVPTTAAGGVAVLRHVLDMLDLTDAEEEAAMITAALRFLEGGRA